MKYFFLNSQKYILYKFYLKTFDPLFFFAFNQPNIKSGEQESSHQKQCACSYINTTHPLIVCFFGERERERQKIKKWAKDVPHKKLRLKFPSLSVKYTSDFAFLNTIKRHQQLPFLFLGSFIFLAFCSLAKAANQALV